MTIPVQLPYPLLCILHLEDRTTGAAHEERRWVAGFTEADPSSEHVDHEDGLPLLVGDTGLVTPLQHAYALDLRLTGWSLAWPQVQQAPPGGGLLIPAPRLN